MESYRIIGKEVPILDAAGKSTGEFKYTDDLKLPGMLYGKMLLSSVPHARIKTIDTSLAEALPGVRAVATYQNSSQVRYNSTTRFYTQRYIENELVFTDVARFVGDRIAAVAADTLAIAEKAVGLIKVEYEELPAVITVEEAMAGEAYPIHPGGNIVNQVEKKAGDISRGFSEADFIFEDTYRTPAIHHGAIETHTAIADFDAQGKLTVISPNQNTFGTRIVLSRIFSLPMSRIRVKSPGIGGGFGGKLEATLEPVAAQLAILCRKPVKLTLNRRETIIATRTRHGTKITLKTGVKKDGTIVAQEITAVSNTGAYASNVMNLIGAMGNKVFKIYKIPHMRFVGIPVYTNTPIAGAMRGYGSPQVFYAQQNQLQKIAKAIQVDVLDMQFKNLVDPDGVDYRTGKPLGNPRPKDCLKRAMELQKNWVPVSDDLGKYVTGIGVAMGLHCSSTYDAHLDQASMVIKMNEDASCVFFTGTHEMGHATVTAQAQAIAEILAMPLEMIDYIDADTDVCGWNVGDFSSRGVYVNVNAAKRAAEEVKETLFKGAAVLLGESPADLALDEISIYSKVSGQRIKKERLMEYFQHELHQDIIATVTYHSQQAPPSYGAHIARVRVEVTSGQVEVLDYVAVHDVGQVINQLGVEGQLEGGINMGIGYALCEGLDYNAKGKATNGSFRKYKILKARQMPSLQMDFIEAIEPSGPFGAKSIAECATVPVAPAVINAVANALEVDIYDLPCIFPGMKRL